MKAPSQNAFWYLMSLVLAFAVVVIDSIQPPTGSLHTNGAPE